MKNLAVAFSGKSGSGKTTLIKKVAGELINRGFKVAIIKHDPGDKARFDTPKKDSYEFIALGADVAVVSPIKTAIFLKSGAFGGDDRINSKAHENRCEAFDKSSESLNADLNKIINKLDPFDYLIIEGLKYIPLPRIVVFREQINDDFIPFANAVATDLQADFGVDKFGLDDVDKIINWINKNAKKWSENE